jgi:hypothetical protein
VYACFWASIIRRLFNCAISTEKVFTFESDEKMILGYELERTKERSTVFCFKAPYRDWSQMTEENYEKHQLG